MIISKLSADICWVVHYLCLGAIAGAIPNFVGIFREIVFLHRKNKKWANYILWPILFIVVNFSLGIRTFHDFYNVLPIMASAVVTISLWINSPKLTKLLSISICCAFITYNFHIHSYVGIINESISILLIIIFFIKRRNLKISNVEKASKNK